MADSMAILSKYSMYKSASIGESGEPLNLLVQVVFECEVQWNLSLMVTHGPEINGCNREVVA